MGFFSWKCAKCGHSILSPYAVNEVNTWMNEAVAIMPDGAFHRGEYDGYGRLGAADLLEGRPFHDYANAEMYHHACWEASGRPTTYRGPSGMAGDQGYFFDDGEHDVSAVEASAPEYPKYIGPYD